VDIKKSFLDRLAEFIAGRITAQSSGYEPYTPSEPEILLKTLQPGDVLLVEGNQKLSAVIKYLTQSTWSHAALYVGNVIPDNYRETNENNPNSIPRLIEVNLGEGCVARPLEKYATYNTRICRPVGLTKLDREKLVTYMVERLGTAYDTRNVFDLARYLLPTPPIPTRWRRKMIAFGSGDPTRAICSTLIAQAFQSIRYPILPNIQKLKDCLEDDCEAYAVDEILHIRHHSLFAPRDFDLSPYFKIVKPTVEEGFDYGKLKWGDEESPENQETEKQ